MTDTLKDIDLSLLEDLFNEPHCESMHRDPRNRKCTHKVVATIVSSCGCSKESCLGQVKFSQWLKSRAIPTRCSRCGANTEAKDTLIFPKG